MKKEMKADEKPFSEAFRRCADFHGHICPGLANGRKVCIPCAQKQT
jgi:formylmethanofuran dehydrogenase subunit E